jgi:hypothetical protein
MLPPSTEPEGLIPCLEESATGPGTKAGELNPHALILLNTIIPSIHNLPSGVLQSWDSPVSISTGYRLDDREAGVRLSVVSRMFPSARRPHRPCDPPSLLSNGNREISWGYSGRDVKLTTHLLPVSRSRKRRSIYTCIPPYVFMTKCLRS